MLEFVIMNGKVRKVIKKVKNFEEQVVNFSFCGSHLKLIALVLVTANLIFASWYFLNGDLNFHSDIGRDFLLLNELEIKKYILIGARTGAPGVFHGVVWYYLMFPIYLISNGNPLALEGFWIILVIGFLYLSFKIAQKLFDEKVAYFYILLLSVYLIFRTTASFSHPDGAFLVMPVFFYTFWRYINTLKLRFLAINVLISGIIIHFELVTGIPLLVMSFAYTFFLVRKKKKLWHMLTFLLVLVPLSTYILFELRHNFFQIKSAASYFAQAKSSGENYFKIITNRFDYMLTTGVQMVSSLDVNRVLAIFFFAMILKSIIKNESRKIYLVSLYFFFGFFIFSLAVPYYLLRHHFVAFIPVIFLMFASLVSNKYGKVLISLFLLIILLGEISAIGVVSSVNLQIGNGKDSWKAINAMTQSIYKSGDREFGYFVYSPDLFAYSPKYAMIYGQKTNRAVKAYDFEKKPVTYVIDAPGGDMYGSDIWWIKNGINIKTEPSNVKTYINGYKVYRYELTPEEITVPYSKLEDLGIHFR